MEAVIVLLIVALICCMWQLLRNAFKIGYYKTRLWNNDLIDQVDKMPWYKLWLN